MTSAVHRDWLGRHPTLPLIAGLPMLRERDAVLASAVGCDLAEVAPFVRSLRAVFSGQILLLVDRDPTLSAWLSTHGVETIVAADRLLHWRPHAAVTRFAVYAQLLQERREIRNVILADVREAVFQSDPFRDAADDLTLFSGAGGALAEAAVNNRAMHALVGEGLARDLGGRPPVSVGLVAGPTEAVVRFCRTLLLLATAPSVGSVAGIDRAACHVIAHLRLAGGAVRANHGRVATASKALRVEDGLIVNPDESFSPVVLGYRRAADIAAHVEATWGLPAVARRSPGAALGRTMRSLQASFMAAF